MNCRRSRELLSDSIERSLAPPLVRELEAHLGACRECAALARSLAEVVAALASVRAPEPPEDLVERVLDRTRPVLRASRDAASSAMAPEEPLAAFFGRGSFWWNASSWLAGAAILAAVLLWRPPEFLAGFARNVSKTAHQTYSFGVRTYYRTERWVEELNVLRMTVGVAFEDRIDRLTERLRDLEEARRKVSEEDEASRSGLHSTTEVASSHLIEPRSVL